MIPLCLACKSLLVRKSKTVPSLSHLFILHFLLHLDCLDEGNPFKNNGIWVIQVSKLGFPVGAGGKKPTCRCGRDETWVQSLGREDSPEEGTATHSSILACRIPSTEQPGRLQSIRSRLKQLSTHAWYLNYLGCNIRDRKRASY